MTPKRRRLAALALALALSAAAAALVLSALDDGIVFFVTPSEFAQRPPPPGKRLRLGGLVEDGSVRREGSRVFFRVSDGAASVAVAYEGLLPDLFREGQGVVVEGSSGSDGLFAAARVLAKHDETYMPKEAVEALKKSGQWRGSAP